MARQFYELTGEERQKAWREAIASVDSDPKYTNLYCFQGQGTRTADRYFL